MDGIVLNIGRPLRIKRICSEEHNDRPMTDKKVLKIVFQISIWCEVVLENIKKYSIKLYGEK